MTRSISPLVAPLTTAALAATVLGIAPATADTNWQPPQTMVVSGQPTTGEIAASALADNGKTVIAYVSFSPTASVNVTVGDGTTWQWPATISTGEALDPAVVISRSGSRALLTWNDRLPDGTTTVSASWYDGASWSPAQALSSASPGHQILGPEVAASSTLARGVVTWQVTHGPDRGMYLMRWNGSTFAPRQRINREGHLVGAPAPAMSTNGRRLTLAMTLGATGSNRVVAQSYRNRRLVAKRTLRRGVEAGTPELGLSADGTKALAAWTEWQGTVSRVQAATSSGGRWTAPRAVGPKNSTNAVLAMAANGRRAVLTWTKGEWDQPNLVQARIWSGGRWGRRETLSPIAARSSQSVTMSARGNRATALWSTWNSGAGPAEAKTWHPAGWLGTRQFSDPHIGGGSSALASSADDRDHVAWWSVDWNPGAMPPDIGLQYSLGIG